MAMKRVGWFLDKYHAEYLREDELECMAERSSINNVKEERLPLQRGRRLVLDDGVTVDNDDNRNRPKSMKNTARKSTVKSQAKTSRKPDSKSGVKSERKSPINRIKKEEVLEKEMSKINEDDMTKMKRLCSKLGITRGINVAVSLYGYPSHVAVYLSLLKMVKMEEEERMVVLEGMTSNEMRDIKSKTGSEGKTGRKNEMKEGIIKKLKELHTYYQRYLSRKQSHSSSAVRQQHHDNGLNGVSRQSRANRKKHEKKRISHSAPSTPSNRKVQKKRAFEHALNGVTTNTQSKKRKIDCDFENLNIR